VAPRISRAMIPFLRAMLGAWRRLRFRLWILELRLRLRASGGILELDAPHGAVLEGRPAVKAYPQGDGDGTLRLRLGAGVTIGRDVAIDLDARGTNEIAIGDDSLIMDRVRLILRSGTIAMGARCNIRDGVWLKSDGMLLLGDDIPIAQNSMLHCVERIEFADFVGLAERVTVLDSDHGFDGSDTYFRDQPLNIEPTTIDRNTFVAAGAVILRGTRIGRNCLVAANAVVRGGDYEAGSMIAGIPGKVVASRGPEADA
jgi:acetyltransferase-like isoleucine patch superfamily enzyme